MRSKVGFYPRLVFMTLVNNFVTTIETRRRLRKDSTVPEQQIWRLLRDRQLSGYKFRRQHGLGPYVVDFYCPKFRLVVEIDGDSHSSLKAQAYDARRTAYFRLFGMEVIRFMNAEVGENPTAVVEAIYRCIETQIGDKANLG